LPTGRQISKAARGYNRADVDSFVAILTGWSVPTTDFSGVVLAGHLGLSAGALAKVFPGSECVAPVGGILRV
jgi:hypothetical protein